MKPDDKPQKKEETFEDPKLFMVVDDKVVPKPGLETAFVANAVETPANATRSKEVDAIISKTVCSCNKVRVATCGCVGYKAPSSSSSSRSSGRSSGGSCRCAPVH